MKILRALAAAAAAGFAVLAYVYLMLPDVRGLATINPKTTAWMDMRAQEAAAGGRPLRHVHRWVPYTRISPNLKRAVLAAEDDAFFEHEGVDLEQLKNAIQQDLQNGRAIRGASTITQQLAKNLYLSPSRDPLRKLRELILARRLETALAKARIFEIYLNVIEWGDGIWGAEAASRTYFGTSAASLSREQAALLAGSIINPRVYSPARPPARLVRRQRIILSRMGGYEPPPPAPVAAPAPTTPSDPPVAPDTPVVESDEPAQPDAAPGAPADPSTAEPSSP
ncbi:MAG TPA: monofunctional biosynthetic peptidoglycan transglycosylase [Hyalangium sp.]|nr:monofunctional biosynthetic peptidoglycan transglycosylase [Hyalangium sp.]